MKSTNPSSDVRHSQPAPDLFERIGLSRPRDEAVFWREIEHGYGSLARQLRQLLEAAGDRNDPDRRVAAVQTFYEVKNRSLDLALAVTGQFRSPVLRRTARAIEAICETPETIVDLGCDIGVLTCFLAERFPHARVVGIDRSREALDRAGEIVDRLGVSNVTLEQSDVRSLSQWEGRRAFDLALGVNVFEFATGWPAPRGYYALSELDALEPDLHVEQALAGLVSAISPGGQFVSVEYFPSSCEHWWWTGALNAAGLSISWERSAAVRLDSNASHPASAMLVSATKRENIERARLEDYFASALLPQLETSADRKVFTDELAEVLFEAISPRVMLRGFEAFYPRESAASSALAERDEVWQAGPMVLVRRVSNAGDRRLELRSCLATAHAVDELRRFADLLANEYQALVRWY